MIYFENNRDDAIANGFLTYLSTLENMKLIVLLADILHVYKRHHKLVQINNMTIISLAKHIESLKASLNVLQINNLPGGWAETLKNALTEENDNILLKGFEMKTTTSTRSSDKRNFDEIRFDIFNTIHDCLQDRFQIDEDLIKIVKPFVDFQEDANVKQIHEMFATDLPLSTLSLEYAQLVRSKDHEKSTLSKQIKDMLNSVDSTNYATVITVLCRINTCTPESADVERTIKANNLLKTAFRNRLHLQTENKYMFIYFNMPPLERWETRTAIAIWLNDKQRREHTDLISKDTARKQTDFSGIFEAAAMDGDSDEEYDNIEIAEKNVKF